MSNMEFIDQEDRRVTMQYKTDDDIPNGNHVLAIPIFQNQLLFTKHSKRGIEFPGGKVEINETSQQAIARELYEETGGKIEALYYIAQYQVHTFDKSLFKKDVYVIKVKSIEHKHDYLETEGPILFHLVNEIPKHQKSYLIKDEAILKCLERVKDLGYYEY